MIPSYLLALRSPEVEVVGITSLFGNVRTKMATQNALYILEFGRPDIPVYEAITPPSGEEKGASRTLSTATTDWKHQSPRPRERWSRGNPPPSSSSRLPTRTRRGHRRRPCLRHERHARPSRRLRRVVKNLREIVHLGGAFFVNGNVNPNAGANVFDDVASTSSTAAARTSPWWVWT